MTNPRAELDQIARFQQMKINARLTALQSALSLMATAGYCGVPGSDRETKEPTWVRPPGTVDMITLIATATEIENYILGQIEEESLKALENAAAKLNGPKIVRP